MSGGDPCYESSQSSPNVVDVCGLLFWNFSRAGSKAAMQFVSRSAKTRAASDAAKRQVAIVAGALAGADVQP